MCYATVYSCNVVCRNTELNITSAINGTISGITPGPDPRCYMTACNLIDRLDSSGFSTMNPPAPGVFTFIPDWAIVAAVFIMAGLLVIAVAVLHSKTKTRP